jgi:hypothetical protein
LPADADPAPSTASPIKRDRRHLVIVPIRNGYSRCARQRARLALLNGRGLGRPNRDCNYEIVNRIS